MNRRDLLKRGIRLAAAPVVVALLGKSAFAAPPAPQQDEWARYGGKFVTGMRRGVVVHTQTAEDARLMWHQYAPNDGHAWHFAISRDGKVTQL